MNWESLLNPIKDSFEFNRLMKKVNEEYETKAIYPPKKDLFKALELTKFEDVKIIILAQDPYHGENQAMGLAFSVKRGVKIPPSLKNIYKELHDDLNIPIPKHGDLSKLAKEGVLLLNTTMTVQKKKPGSHHSLGWNFFTDEVIKILSKDPRPKVFMLFGRHAKSKETLINQTKHLVIKTPHPSPLSAYRGFFKSKPFSKANAFLKEKGRKPVHFNVLNL